MVNGTEVRPHAAPKGTELRWYRAGHELNVQAERNYMVTATLDF